MLWIKLLLQILGLFTSVFCVIGTRRGYKVFNNKISEVAKKYPGSNYEDKFNEIKDMWIIGGWITIVIWIIVIITTLITKGEVVRIGY